MSRERALVVMVAEDELAQVLAHSGDAVRTTTLVADAFACPASRSAR